MNKEYLKTQVYCIEDITLARDFLSSIDGVKKIKYEIKTNYFTFIYEDYQSVRLCQQYIQVILDGLKSVGIEKLKDILQRNQFWDCTVEVNIKGDKYE